MSLCEHLKRTGEKEICLDCTHCYFRLLWCMGNLSFVRQENLGVVHVLKIHSDKKQTVMVNELVLHIPLWMNEFLMFMKSLLRKASVKFYV